MIAYCGMDCSKCEGYLATKEDNDTKRKENQGGTAKEQGQGFTLLLVRD